MLKRIKNLDLFGREPNLYYKSNPRKSSWFGLFLTILYILMYITFFVYKIVRMVEKLDVTFYESFGFDGNIPSVVISPETFGGGIGIKDPSTGQVYVNDSIYEVKSVFKIGKKDENDVMHFEEKPLLMIPCKLDFFGSNFKEVFSKRNLNNLLCFDKANITGLILEGYQNLNAYSYFDISIYRCRNTTEKQNCLPIKVIDKYLTAAQLTVTIQDIDLTPQNYNSPVKYLDKDLPAPLFKELHQEIYGYLQLTYIETEENIIGFEILSNIKKELYLKYDTSMIMASPNIYGNYEDPLGQLVPLTTIRIQLANKVLTQKRYYSQLINVLGDVGGLMEVFYSLFNFLSSLIVGILYEESLVNNLFNFDLDRKIITLKENNFKGKITTMIKNEHETLLNPSSRNLNKNFDNGIQNILNSKSALLDNAKTNEIRLTFRHNDNDKNDPNITNKESTLIMGKSKIKKRMKKKKRINDLSRIKTFDCKIFENNSKIFDKKKKGDFYANNDEKNNNNDGFHGIVNKIALNKFLVHTLCCFIRYPKNLKNILLDEGIKIITEQLEVFNLFIKLYKIERDQKESDMKECAIEMSRGLIADYNKFIYQISNNNLDKSIN